MSPVLSCNPSPSGKTDSRSTTIRAPAPQAEAASGFVGRISPVLAFPRGYEHPHIASPSHQHVPYAGVRAISSENGGPHEAPHRAETGTLSTGLLDRTVRDSGSAEAGQQLKARYLPQDLVVRFTDRTNSTPRSGIIEQGSRSMLSSYSSHLGIDSCFQLIEVDDGGVMHGTSKRASRSTDASMLNRLQESTLLEQDEEDSSQHTAVDPEQQDCNFKSCMLLPIASSSSHPQPFPTSRAPDPAEGIDGKGFRGMLRGMLQTARASSRRDSSHPSIAVQPAFVDRESRPPKKEESLQTSHSGHEEANIRTRGSVTYDTSHAALDPLFTLHSKDGSLENSGSRRGPKSVDAGSQHGTAPLFSREHTRAASTCYKTDPASSSPMFPPFKVAYMSPHERAVALSLDTRNAVEDYITLGTSTLSTRSRDDEGIRYTSDGVTIFRTNAPSVREYDQARDASFCSSLSTTYSGTVLGIDLDLQEHPIVKDASRSTAHRSPTPVWNLPPLLPHEEKESTPPPSIHKEKYTPVVEGTSAVLKSRATRSITSSALPILLPLAAASGIIKPNYGTPQLSFFSPSGNLIQTIPPSRSWNNVHAQRSQSNGEPPSRPAFLPMTTPPRMTARLPAHLRPSQHTHTHTHIVPEGGIVTPSRVRGCDGMIRKRSLQPRSGVGRQHPYRPHNHAQDYKNPHAWAGPSLQSRSNAVASCGLLPKRKALAEDSPVCPMHRANPAPMERLGSNVGELLGWILRVCFCQPWDGAGKEGFGHMANQSSPYHHAQPAENARVVSWAKKIYRCDEPEEQRSSTVTVNTDAFAYTAKTRMFRQPC